MQGLSFISTKPWELGSFRRSKFKDFQTSVKNRPLCPKIAHTTSIPFVNFIIFERFQLYNFRNFSIKKLTSASEDPPPPCPLKILKKLRTASLNSEFTGSYKKSVMFCHFDKLKVFSYVSERGVKLENYYVQPICSPTRGQLLTGRYQVGEFVYYND